MKRRNYSPSKGFMLGFIYSHVYSLGEFFNNKNLCKYTVTK